MLGLMKYTHWLVDHNMVSQKYCFVGTCSHLRTISHHNQKTDTTTQLYCTLSKYLTPKTISHQNQKTNTTPQLYCTLSTQVCKTKNYFPPEPKLTQQHNWKKVPPAHAQRVYLFLCLWFHPWVMAKWGM